MSAPAPDWLGAARAAARELQEVLAAAPTTAERARETGTRGEGGDRTLEIDAAAEAAVFRRLEALHADGAPLRRGQRGARPRRLRRRPGARRDRPARRLEERQARPAAPRALARGRRRRHDGRRRVRLRARLRRRRGVGRAARRAAPRSTARRSTRRVPERRVARQARAARDRVRRPALGARLGRGAGRDRAHRLRAIGAIAVSLCQVAAARLDGMVTLRRSRAVDVAAGAADRARGGRRSSRSPRCARAARRAARRDRRRCRRWWRRARRRRSRELARRARAV